MRKLLTLLALAVTYAQNPVTPSYPAAVATDSDVLVANDGSFSTLSGSINNVTTTIPIASSTLFLAGEVITIESEKILIGSVGSGQLLGVTRGYGGTTSAGHSFGVLVRGNVNAIYHNVLAAQIKAIESTLGSNLSTVNNYQTFIGSGSYTVPTGVTRVFAQVWAGGGGGVSNNGTASIGGGGGGYVDGWCTVTPGVGVAVVVGLGGTLGVVGGNAGLGGNSSFGSCMTAIGGGTGSDATAWQPGRDNAMPVWDAASISAGACSACLTVRPDGGGSGAAAVGGVNLPGQIGGHAPNGGGGGGSGAYGGGTLAVGAGGKSGRGGTGGNGGGVTVGIGTVCSNGSIPGGGGGGASWDGTTSRNGCAGARGEVRIWR